MAHKLSYRLLPQFQTSLLSCRQTLISTVMLKIKVLPTNLHLSVQEKRAWVVGEQNGQTKDIGGLGSKGEKRDTTIPDHECSTGEEEEQVTWNRHAPKGMRSPVCLSVFLDNMKNTKWSRLCDVEDEWIIFSCWYGSYTCHELVLCWPQSEPDSVVE